MKSLTINGQKKQFPDRLPQTLAELLELLKIEAATVVAEIDGQIIELAKFPQTKLTEHQNIELIRFVPGG